MTPKQIAREWLYLLGGLFFSQIFVLTLSLLTSDNGFIGDFYSALFLPTKSYHSPIEKIVAWVVTLAPYIIFQFVRSIVWAVKTIRQK